MVRRSWYSSNPDLFGETFRGEGDDGLTHGNLWSFILSLICWECGSHPSSSPFFFLLFLLFFLKKINWQWWSHTPLFADGGFSLRPYEVDRYTVEILGWCQVGMFGKRWGSISGVGDWPPNKKASKKWVRKGERPVDDKYLLKRTSQFDRAQSNLKLRMVAREICINMALDGSFKTIRGNHTIDWFFKTSERFFTKHAVQL